MRVKGEGVRSEGVRCGQGKGWERGEKKQRSTWK